LITSSEIGYHTFCRSCQVAKKLVCNFFGSSYLLSVVAILALTQVHSYGQQNEEASIAEIESELKDLFGLDKLIALNKLSVYYGDQGSRKAIRFGRQAVWLGENIFVNSNTEIDLADRSHLLQAYFQLGEIFYERDNFFEALEQFEAASALALELNESSYHDAISDYRAQIESKIESGEIKENFFNKTFSDLKLGETISNASKDLAIQAEIKMGASSEKKGDREDAIDHYQKAINMLRDMGDAAQVNDLQLKIAVLLEQLSEHEEAQSFLTDAIDIMEKDLKLETTDFMLDSLPVIEVRPAAPKPSSDDPAKVETRNLKNLAETYAKNQDYEKSLAYYKLYQELSEKMVSDSLRTEAEKSQRINEIMLLKQQKQIADLNVSAARFEKDKQIRIRNLSVVFATLLLIGSIVTLQFYVSKRREHRRLSIAYRDLDKTKGKLVNAERRIIKLLRQQVSGDVAQELLTNSLDEAGARRFVCIMFLDIRDFTPMAESMSPEQLIRYQNDVFGFMIDIVQKHHGNINQLLGDGFMATFGAPVSHGNDCQNAYNAAKEILRESKDRIEAELIPNTQFGIGLHAGHVVTGNVGTEARKQYSVTGNPVIVASRIEQLNKEYKTQLIITEEVYQKLEKPLKLNQPFLEVEVKGRSNPVRILKIA